LKGIEPNGDEMIKGLEEDDIGELINSLQNIGRAIKKIEKKLGIKKTPLPTIDLEEYLQ
jgi:hypothetical protein